MLGKSNIMRSGSAVVLLVLFNCALSDKNTGPRAVTSLKFLVVVSKHGARVPTHTYPRDPYKNHSIWPDGSGQVTKVGKQQMYRVGQKLRLLYNGYLSSLYHSSQVLAQSSTVDRTMISAATLLAGLYSPQSHQLWHPNISWQPVPIYPNLLDKTMLTLDPSNCPRYWQEQNNSLAAFSQQDSHHADIYQAMTQGTGRNMSSCSQMYLLYHNLAAVTENNLPLPNWAEKIFLPRMLPVVSQMVQDSTLKNVKMIKILNGLFLHKITELLQRRERKQSGEQLSMFLHVGHDLTLMCLLAALGFSKLHIPWSSTTLMFELHHNEALQSMHEIQVLKIDGRCNSSNTPEHLELPICRSPCDLYTFVNCTKKYTTKDWRQECHDMTSPSDQK